MQITAEWAAIRRCLDLLHKLKPEYVKLSVDAKGQATLSASPALTGGVPAYLRTRLRAKAAMPGEVIVQYARLRGVINGARAQHVTITKTEDAVQVTADAFRARLLPAPPDSGGHPDWLDENGAELCALPCGLFKGLLGDIVPFVPHVSGRFTVGIALFECDGSTMRAVGTNGFCTAISEEKIAAAPCSFILPQHAFNPLFAMAGLVLRVSASDSYLAFETETDLLRVVVAQEQFPPYRNTLPKVAATTTITIADKEALQAAIKSCLAVCESKRPIVECYADANGTVLSVQAGTAYEGHRGKRLLEDGATAVGAAVAGPAIDFSFDGEWFLPFLSKATVPIVLHVISNTTVLDFRANGGQFRYLQMPTNPATRTIGAAAK